MINRFRQVIYLNSQLSTRQILLCKELMRRDYTSKNELMAKLNVKDRTLRKDIEAINHLLGEESIKSKRNYGYYINNLPAFDKLNLDNEMLIIENRIFYITKQLVISNTSVDIFDLAEQLFVSEATIEKDLLVIKNKLNQYTNLTMKRSHSLVFLVGDEKVRRSLLCEMMLEEAVSNDFNINIFDKCFNIVSLKDIEQIVSKLLKKYNVNFDDITMLSIILHVAITTERSIVMTDKNNNDDKFSEYSFSYKIANEILSEVERKYDVFIQANQTNYLSLLIEGKYLYSLDRNKDLKSPIENDIIYKIIDYIYEVYDIDFRNDKELSHDLSLHLYGLKKRILTDVPVHNVLLDEIKKSFPFIFEVGVDIANQYEIMTNVTLEESEIGFIVLHLVCAFERLNVNNKKIKVLIMCPTGETSRKLLSIKINNAFQEKIELLGTYGLNDVDQDKLSMADLIISTVQIHHQDLYTNKNIIICSPFLNDDDVKNIDETINRLKKTMFLIKKSKFFENDLFVCNQDFHNKEEAIKYLSDLMLEKGYVSKDYYESVLERENLSSTAFYEGVAIPHAMKMNAKQTKIAVAIMQKPITWGKYKVKLIFLLSFRNQDKREMFNLYEKLSLLKTQSTIFKKLCETTNFDEFVNVIENI